MPGVAAPRRGRVPEVEVERAEGDAGETCAQGRREESAPFRHVDEGVRRGIDRAQPPVVREGEQRAGEAACLQVQRRRGETLEAGRSDGLQLRGKVLERGCGGVDRRDVVGVGLVARCDLDEPPVAGHAEDLRAHFVDELHAGDDHPRERATEAECGAVVGFLISGGVGVGGGRSAVGCAIELARRRHARGTGDADGEPELRERSGRGPPEGERGHVVAARLEVQRIVSIRIGDAVVALGHGVAVAWIEFKEAAGGGVTARARDAGVGVEFAVAAHVDIADRRARDASADGGLAHSGCGIVGEQPRCR